MDNGLLQEKTCIVGADAVAETLRYQDEAGVENEYRRTAPIES